MYSNLVSFNLSLLSLYLYIFISFLIWRKTRGDIAIWDFCRKEPYFSRA